MSRRLAVVLPILLAAAAAAPAIAAEDREADHTELRAMLVTLRDAVNQKQIDKVEPLLADHFAITFADDTLVTSAADLKRYFQQLTDPQSGPLVSLTLEPVADELTSFIAPDVGVCHGRSHDTFGIRGGITRVLDSRWTATVARQGGHWKLAALHVGANVLDNVILSEHKRLTRGVAVGGMVGALVVGFAGFLVGRRRRAA
jgi:ketosteroid isomerase-like protein